MRNRIVVSPMSMYDATPDGLPTHWHDMHYGGLAVSGPGLIMVEATYTGGTHRSTRRDLGLWNEEQADAFAAMLARWRAYAPTRFGIQLSHAGRKGATAVAWRPEDVPNEWPLKAPSALAFDGHHRIPEAMTRAEIKEAIAGFVHSTELAVRAGFDMIELHAGHGYLLHTFLSPLSNQRTDEYGGTLENRMRLVLEVFEAVRAVWPQDRPIGVRLSCSDWIDGGWDIGQSLILCARLKELGCDLITASSGGVSLKQVISRGPGYQVHFANEIRRHVGIATLTVGMITEAEQAENILTAGEADLIGIGRAILYRPRWAWEAARTLGAKPDYAPHFARAVKEFNPGA